MRPNTPVILLMTVLLGSAASVAGAEEMQDEALINQQNLPDERLPKTVTIDPAQFSDDIPLPPPFDPSYKTPAPLQQDPRP
jgi:hypothetical protein